MATFLIVVRNQRLDAENARRLARIARETGQALPRKPPPGSAADALTLRGIPAVGRGVSGQIRGTQPEQALLSALA